ncbi:MAG: hypothetical protein ACKERG_04660 [Candidatus Hodgkinia cicadicola]
MISRRRLKDDSKTIQGRLSRAVNRKRRLVNEINLPSLVKTKRPKIPKTTRS